MKKLHGWRTATISDVATIGGGSGFPEIYQGSTVGDYPFIKVSDLNLPGNEKYVQIANNWINEDVRKKLKAKVQPIGAIVFAKVGGALLTNKRRILTRPTIIDNNMMSLAATDAHPGYLYQVMLSIDLGRYRQEGAVPSVNGSRVGEIALDLPPLPEQRKIADILSTWDKALETLDALIAAKDRQKQALMQQLLTGKTRVKGFDKSGGKTKSDRFGVYPADWKKVALADIIQEVSARNSGGQNLPVLSCTKHRGLVLSQEYFGKRVHAEDTSGYRVVCRGEFAYATNHIEEGSIGYQNLVDAGLVSPIYTVFKTKGEIDDNYLFRVLKSPLLIHFYQINTSASVDRRGSLRFDEFSRIRIWIPSKPEQLAITTILDTADQELTLLRTQRSSIDQQKRGLMQRLLTGRIRVKTP